MTLVVARIHEGKIYLESDSKITDEKFVRSNPLSGMLKTLIIHPFVCVSFSGNVYFAKKAIEIFFEKKIEQLDLLISILLAINNESNNTTDFIVASVIGDIPKLFKISDAKVEQDLTSAWIGDKDGFEYFQKVFYTSDKTIPMMSRISAAFSKVIENKSLPTISDFQVSTISDTDISPGVTVFMHKLSVSVSVTESQTITFEKKGEAKPIPLGTAAGGSSGVSYLVTANPDFHGVAIYFIHGNFGILYCPQLGFEGILINAVSGREFMEHIKKQYGIGLLGFINSSATAIQYLDSRGW